MNFELINRSQTCPVKRNQTQALVCSSFHAGQHSYTAWRQSCASVVNLSMLDRCIYYSRITVDDTEGLRRDSKATQTRPGLKPRRCCMVIYCLRLCNNDGNVITTTMIWLHRPLPAREQQLRSTILFNPFQTPDNKHGLLCQHSFGRIRSTVSILF